MLMDFNKVYKKYKLQINGVLHVGAHYAEEAKLYSDHKAGPVWWVEANPEVQGLIKSNLRGFPNQTLIEALVFSEDNIEKDFNVTNYGGMSSSIYEFGTHTSFSPDIHFEKTLKLKTKTLNTIWEENYIEANFLNMDLQGAEGPALLGADKIIDKLDYVMTEVNKDQVYVDCTQIGEIDEILSDFKRVETFWVGNQGWGDALYIRKTLLGGK